MQTIVGPWLVARNAVSDRAGSIHDDAAARSLGFPGGLVGGNVQVAAVTRTLTDVLGPPWYERGFLRHTWVKPVYDSEQLQATVTELDRGGTDECLVDVKLHKRDGTLVVAGFAGLCAPDAERVPPWRHAMSRPERDVDGYDPLPERPGEEYPDGEITITPQYVERSLAGLDDSAWYHDASPWGDAVVPTVAQLVLGGFGRPDTPRPVAREMLAGMNATSEILQTGPLFVGRTYRRRAALAAKGAAGRYAFRTIEFETFDESGVRVAWFRWKIKWVTTRPSF